MEKKKMPTILIVIILIAVFALIIKVIITLTSTKISLDTIDTAKMGVIKSTSLSYIERIENEIMISEAVNGNTIENGFYTVDTLQNKFSVIDYLLPDNGILKIENNKVVEAKICYEKLYKGKNSVYYNGKEAEYKKDAKYCEESYIDEAF